MTRITSNQVSALALHDRWWSWWVPLFAFALWIWVCSFQCACAQDDYYPLPDRSPSQFGFPYPPPAPDEPGVTLTRRYMLDGYPALEFSPRPQDELWLVSTRDIQSLDCSGKVPLDQFVCKHTQGTGWNRVPIEQLIDVHNRHQDLKTVIFIHGNRTDAFWARRRSKQAYQALIANQSASCPPVRFIIWSWPSDPDPGPRFLADFSSKIERSDFDGHLLGQFLGQLRREKSILMVTYSLGTQIALTGLEHMVMRADAANDIESQPTFDMIAMAPATNCFWPQHPWRMEASTSQIDSLRLVRNPDDIAMRAFQAFCKLNGRCYRATGAEALLQSHHNVRQYDVSDGVGCEHSIVNYVSQPEVLAEVRELIMR
ncbi:MAG: alpha/beta hydrolase [Pirellulaceae bacterium]